MFSTTVAFIVFGLLAFNVEADLKTKCDTIYANLPSGFVTDMQANYRFVDVATGIPTTKINSIRQSTDNFGQNAFLQTVTKAQDEDSVSLYYEKIIWNNALTGTDNTYLHVVKQYSDVDKLSLYWCNANDTLDVFLDVLLSLYDSDVHEVPSVGTMLHFGSDKQYHCDSEHVTVGISTVKFTKSFNVPNHGEFDIAYYWLDPDFEVNPDDAEMGVSVPVAMTAKGIYVDANNVKYNLTATFDYHNFIPKPAPQEEFYLPADITCDNRADPQPIPGYNMPDNFAFTSESIYYSPYSKDAIKIIPRRQWFHSTTNMSKTQYASVTETPYGEDDIMDYITEFRDFSQGLLYILDSKWQNCSVISLARDMAMGDVIHLPDGRMIMPSAFNFFNLESLYNYNGMFSERGMDIMYYVTTNNQSVNNDTRIISTVLGLIESDLEVTVEGDGTTRPGTPVFLEHYITEEYDNPKRVFTQNIFGFDGSFDDDTIFLTKPCFDDKHTDDKVIRFDINLDFYKNNLLYVYLVRAIRKGIATAGKVQQMRIQDIDLDYNMKDGKLYVFYTIVDFPKNQLSATDLNLINYDKMDENIKRPLTEVVTNIGLAVSSGNLTVFVVDPFNTTEKLIKTADSDYYVVATGRNDAHNYVTKNIYGYSDGAMGGLAILFLLLAIGVTVGGMWLVKKRGFPGKRLMTVENPLSKMSYGKLQDSRVGDKL